MESVLRYSTGSEVLPTSASPLINKIRGKIAITIYDNEAHIHNRKSEHRRVKIDDISV